MASPIILLKFPAGNTTVWTGSTVLGEGAVEFFPKITPNAKKVRDKLKTRQTHMGWTFAQGILEVHNRHNQGNYDTGDIAYPLSGASELMMSIITLYNQKPAPPSPPRAGEGERLPKSLIRAIGGNVVGAMLRTGSSVQGAFADALPSPLDLPNLFAKGMFDILGKGLRDLVEPEPGSAIPPFETPEMELQKEWIIHLPGEPLYRDKIPGGDNEIWDVTIPGNNTEHQGGGGGGGTSPPESPDKGALELIAKNIDRIGDILNRGLKNSSEGGVPDPIKMALLNWLAGAVDDVGRVLGIEGAGELVRDAIAAAISAGTNSAVDAAVDAFKDVLESLGTGQDEIASDRMEKMSDLLSWDSRGLARIVAEDAITAEQTNELWVKHFAPEQDDLNMFDALHLKLEVPSHISEPEFE
jgi:hypothetical protein